MKRLFNVFALPILLAACPSQLQANQPPATITLTDFKLIGDLNGEQAAFTLAATARVENSKGATFELLSGLVALTDIGPHPRWRVLTESNRFILQFERAGKFPIQLKFNASVREHDGWKSVNFHLFPGVLQPVLLRGLAADTQFEFPGAARPERRGDTFASFLPADGAVNLSWKQAPTETEGKLFYSAEVLSQISVSPGLMRQVALLNFKVMQGDLKRLSFLLKGPGEVTRVQGEQVLAWNVEPVTGTSDRRLVVQFNQIQKDQFALQVQMETSLGAFPQFAEPLYLLPEGATRFAGYFRIINEGAVRLEVVQAIGLAQISPEQFPETETSRAALRLTGTQRFAYRLSGPDFALRIQADQIVPELNVSQLLAFHLSENELAIDAEFELEIRDAPLRELLLRIPKGYAIARLNMQGMSDYFVSEPDGQPNVDLRIVYAQPITGRQLLQLRLENNKALGENLWLLPRIEVTRAKSVRGHIAGSADPGFRLTPERTQGLTEIATAFFPRKVPGIQTAFRLSDPVWQASLRVERLPQTIQADVLHLFSIGEGIAYGSSVMNYIISGAPMPAFKVELSDEYFNVEFTGKDTRNWQKVPGGYLVQLHTPVSGAYTLLATYERPFKSQGETLAFNGARPLDAQSEQGHTVVISAYQFQVKTADVSAGLLPLEPGEVPPEYRLFFDAPVLAAYRYTSRPFNLRLALSPLAQGDSLSQIVDRASLNTRISRQGQLLTDAHYFVKNRGNPNFRLTLPVGNELWSARVNGLAVVPVLEGNSNIIPLPQRPDPNAVLVVDLQLAATSRDPKHVTVSAPVVNAPVTLAEWKLQPDAGQRLEFRKGSMTPLGGISDNSGFVGLTRMFTGDEAGRAWSSLSIGLFLLASAVVVLRWGANPAATRFNPKHLLGLLLGCVSLLMAGIALYNLDEVGRQQRVYVSHELSFLAPVQLPGSAAVIDVSNLPDKFSLPAFLDHAWPAVLAVVLWLLAIRMQRGWLKSFFRLLGWLLIGWAALRSPNGARVFLLILALFTLWHIIIPVFRHAFRLPRQPQTNPPAVQGGAAAATAALTILVCCHFSNNSLASDRSDHAFSLSSSLSAKASGTADGGGGSHVAPRPVEREYQSKRMNAIAESVIQDIRIEDKFALATAKIRWQATKGQTLPLLFEPAVMTRLVYPSNAIELIPNTSEKSSAQSLFARKDGTFEISVDYEMHVTKRDTETGILLPVQNGIISRVNLRISNLDMNVYSPQAVSIECEISGSNTVAILTLAPASQTWVGWKPRSRDLRHETPVFYTELVQLYVPSAGVIEGAHTVVIRPAQGELNELVLDVPPGATVTDVSEFRTATQLTLKDSSMSATNSLVSLWRFDPETRKLRVNLNPAQSRAFTILVRSQVATAQLPLEQSLGLLRVENAAGQVGLIALATGNEVQLDSVISEKFSSINIEDFPVDLVTLLQPQFPGLTLRRAFRYGLGAAASLPANSFQSVKPGNVSALPVSPSLSLRASAVEPDVRVETQDTLSLGEDRTVLAVNATVDISRAGIFRLSFPMPQGFDVESVSGSALSHWTESKSEAERVLTIHLPGKTDGRQQFMISLAGPGVKPTNSWFVPQLVLWEANKQRSTLLVVPEQGWRLQLAQRDGVTQIDPEKSGIRQKGVLAFRILQMPWKLALAIEQFAPWIQVTSLQHGTVSEAQVKVIANLQYQIENTGLKSFHVLIPTNAETVRFNGDQISDFLPVSGTITNGLQEWEIKLHRRVIGSYLLQTSFQSPVPELASEVVMRGVQAAGVNLQRGFVTVQSAGRLQLNPGSLPEQLQPAEWQSIPRSLKQDLQTAPANFAWRLVEPSFQLRLKIGRHEAAKLLPARVNNIFFNSVISDDGVMLTQARLELLPGDKRLLYLTLPKDARFWFAFVNQNGVWPWRDQASILIPLEQQSRAGKPLSVEFFYSSRIGSPDSRGLNLELLAPKFDLPLEDITWRVSLSDKWNVKHWSGTLQLLDQQIISPTESMDLQTYLQKETTYQHERTKEAEELMAAGNIALQQGNPLQARRSFQAAYGLSSHDAAFNEDARVQLHNIKLQQALVGLNVRQGGTLGDEAPLGGKFRDVHDRKEISYSQQDARNIIDRNSADENASFMRLAERLIQQQEAALSNPSAIKSSIPDQGRVLIFKRAMVVDRWVDLTIKLTTTAVETASRSARLLILGLTLVFLGALAFLARRLSF